MNKVAVVTGSRRGIGLAIAKTLAQEGYTTVFSATSPADTMTDLLAELTAKGQQVSYLRCDISSPADRASRATAALSRLSI